MYNKQYERMHERVRGKPPESGAQQQEPRYITSAFAAP